MSKEKEIAERLAKRAFARSCVSGILTPNDFNDLKEVEQEMQEKERRPKGHAPSGLPPKGYTKEQLKVMNNALKSNPRCSGCLKLVSKGMVASDGEVMCRPCWEARHGN